MPRTRAAPRRCSPPPEDFGEIWRYQWLHEALADTAHPDHAKALEYAGEHDLAYYLPEAPDTAEIDHRLRADEPEE